MATTQLLVGIDIGDNSVQVAYYDESQFEPVAIESHVNQTDGDEYIIEECLQAIYKTFEEADIVKITVCLENYTRERARIIQRCISNHNIKSDDILVLNYKQSYLYYVLNQSSEMWVNDVGLFQYNNGTLIYRQLAVDRRKTPYIAGIIERDYSDMIQQEVSGDIDKGYLFENIAENAIHKQIISTIYVTGNGFDGKWADDSLRKLCRGRRVFKGHNLYVRGACYASRKKAGKGNMPEVIFIDDDMTPVHVSTSVYVNAGIQEVIISKAGQLWYEADNSIYVIPDNENEMQINFTNVITHTKTKHLIPLDFLGIKRLDLKTRVRVRIRFQSIDKCIITLSDEGFGEVLKSSRKMFEKIVNLDTH